MRRASIGRTSLGVPLSLILTTGAPGLARAASASTGQAAAFAAAAAAYNRGDYADALSRFRRLADQGYALGEYDLGAMYGNGLGMPQDYVRAYKWFDLAATAASDAGARDRAAKDRDGLAAGMTAAQIAQARKLAADCLRSHFLECD
jgi:hypothetical protein